MAEVTFESSKSVRIDIDRVAAKLVLGDEAQEQRDLAELLWGP